jgi:hypothetical protein
MAEWEFIQKDPAEQLAKLNFFSIKRKQAIGEIEFRIVVKEFVTRQDQSMQFFAEADKQTNQNTAPFTPTGWRPATRWAKFHCLKSTIPRVPSCPAPYAFDDLCGN